MKKLVTIIGVMLLAGVIAYPVFADGPGRGKGYHMRGYGGSPGYCRQNDGGARGLNQDQRDKLSALDRKFFNETETLRNGIQSKNVEMDNLLNAQNPDEGKMKSLQKEISTLKNQLAEKRLGYRLEARKIAPDGYYGGNARRYSGGRGGFRGKYGRGGCGN